MPTSAPQAKAAATPSPSVPNALAQALDEANRAYARADYTRAAELYARALAVEPGSSNHLDVNRLHAFARLRLGLLALVDSNDDRARQVLQEEFRAEKDEPFRQMAFQLWDTYAMTGDLDAACARVTAFAQERGIRVDARPLFSIAPDQVCVAPRRPR